MTSPTLPPGIRFHEALAADWSAGYVHGGFKRRLDFVERLLSNSVEPGSRWLDAGCGSGVLTRLLARLGASGDAIDASPAMIQTARQLSAGDRTSSQFAYHYVDTIERLDIADNVYDGVLCSSVIEYLDAPLAAFRELTRVTKPGGRILLSVANRYSVIRALQRLIRAAGMTKRFQYLDVSLSTFSFGEISAVLHACGVLINDVRGFDPTLPAWSTQLVPPALIFVVGTKEPDRRAHT